MYRLLDSLRGEEVFELGAVAIEDVDIDIAHDAFDAAIGTELPEGQTDIGLVLSVAGNPHIVIAFDIGSQREVLVDKILIDIENR